ncbi:RCS-specific HTH-type transcriptional activator RclR [Mycolicibacterium vanbaalenii]|uniref:RCS-specific HTH-type transcriptional activator RclR n=1 Tax=Mycolicibacterium vanbaalenii TaxID=110539 RepID=A0A5S9R8K1_MYCVN|nr:AraC family transcriptional regulator [Mycolicibacterium vanbaalenii]CAA0136486.1 RCS-specific HTH-type transcriptional activator RclR [Mycolicibacterium vanbaalenii]
MDILADVLSATKLRGTVAASVSAAAPWGIDFPPLPFAAFHYVLAGGCWLRRPGDRPLPLSTGDLALLPVGTGHVIASDPSGPTASFTELTGNRPDTLIAVVDISGPGPRTHLLCGGYHFDGHSTHPMLRLPPEIVLRDVPNTHPSVAETLAMMQTEIAQPSPGSVTVVDRLVDVLFVHTMRAATTSATLLAGLHDDTTAAAVSLIHQQPAHPWTVALLAANVGVSRATLARHFARTVGEPPLAYLTRWRMEIAARRLRQTSDPLSRVAEAVGYTSEFALSRAFKRHHGLTPREYRVSTHGNRRG